MCGYRRYCKDGVNADLLFLLAFLSIESLILVTQDLDIKSEDYSAQLDLVKVQVTFVPFAKIFRDSNVGCLSENSFYVSMFLCFYISYWLHIFIHEMLLISQ